MIAKLGQVVLVVALCVVVVLLVVSPAALLWGAFAGKWTAVVGGGLGFLVAVSAWMRVMTIGQKGRLEKILSVMGGAGRGVSN